MHDDIAKEKMVLAVGLPDLPLAKTVLKPSPDVPRGKIAREVTETTHIKVQHTHAFDVKSFVLTSETVRNTQDIKCGGDVSVKTEVSKVSDLRPSDEDNEQLQYLKKLQEVSPEVPWNYNCVTKQVLKSCVWLFLILLLCFVLL